MTNHTDSSKEIEIQQEFMAAQGKAAAEYKKQCEIDRDRGHLADCDFSEGAQWAYRHLSGSPSSSGWIEIKQGCEMPQIDELVLWRAHDGNYFTSAIDKDDFDWWNVTPRCTHWSRVTPPTTSGDK